MTVQAAARERIDGPALTRWTALLVATVLAYALVFSVASAAKYVWYGQGHDLVLHEQAIWNTTQGRIFEVTGFVHPARLFGYDPYLIELLVVPLYALLPSVYTLLVLQSVVIALGGVAVWRIARDEGLAPLLAYGMVVLYLAYPVVQYTNMDAFRERSFGLCFFLWAMWAFRRGRWRTFLVFLVLLIICRLDAALFAACFALYALLVRRERRYVVVPAILGLGYFFVGDFIFVPLVNQGHPVSYVYEYFQPLGATMGQVARTVVTHPLFTLQATFRVAKVEYLFLLLLPLAGLPLLAPRELVFTLPILGLNLLATKPELSNIRYWYSMLLVGPLIVATIVAVRRLQGRWPASRARPWLILAPLGCCLLLAQVFPRNPVVSLVLHHEPPARLATANGIVRAIPPDARVAASSRLATHLLRRYEYYYPLADLSVLPTLDYIAADVASDSFDSADGRAQLEAIRHSPDWELIIDKNGYQLFKRRR
ncbi:MAG TPA: DUF2079 domain-containing protein [Thermomicrobiales bacterium]|nr:DUF2079 domain-containing protein [Thermomicrobiales bacterium]